MTNLIRFVGVQCCVRFQSCTIQIDGFAKNKCVRFCKFEGDRRNEQARECIISIFT